MSSTDIEGKKKDEYFSAVRAGLDNWKPKIRREIKLQNISELIIKALNKFVVKDSYLIQANANERSMTAKIACYLQELFPGWDVDHEYNRACNDPKRLQDDRNINPDIIIHKRGTKKNLLVPEAKKAGSSSACEREKLKSMLCPHLNYRHAMIIRRIDKHKPVEEWIEFVSEEPNMKNIFNTD